MNGKHIEIFLVDGVPGGMTTAEIAGWTGHVLASERSSLGALLRRPEAQRNGAYLFLSDDSDAVAGVRTYIGRTENFARRFPAHAELKSREWDRIVIVTNKDDSFSEGHWGYLESRLVELARLANRCTLTNGNDPQGRRLSEAAQSDMEAFLAQLQIVLPVLGVDVIRSRETAKAADSIESVSPEFTLTDTRRKVDARAQVIDGEFTLLTGSTVIAKWISKGIAEATQRAYAVYREEHERLLADGSIVVENGVGRVARDIRFTSPSRAGAIALGRSCNGRISWTWSGGTYAQWEDRGVDEINEDAHGIAELRLTDRS
ncbi:GIY-YIG nuclease family protein [Brooklawnia propionicigenes]|uniref:GIY-YIG nuclease family protein n=1 Tax=Brooklawnia propionicigenes TaxID=3041175 RepID=A0AAN0KH73_9ACTN|nr:DUF4357 domain-containing protein [Brooklawnia sp. SH051]BEH03203.1 GIY-YIG nuclease family protein [Brooklawnia sp. SH051]